MTPLASSLIYLGAQEALKAIRAEMSRTRDLARLDQLATQVEQIGAAVAQAAQEFRSDLRSKLLQEAQNAPEVPAENPAEDESDGSGGTGDPKDVPELSGD